MSYSWEPYRKVHAEPVRNPAAHLSYSVPRPHGWARGSGGSSNVGPSVKRSGCGHGLLYHKSSESLELTLPASFSDDGGLNEKQLMQGLNDRFAGYIEKVRQLEQQNRGLESEIVELRQRRCSPSRLAAAFEPELRELRQLLQGMERQKVQVELERERLAGDVQHLKGRYEDEARLRAEMEASARLFGQHAEDSQRFKRALDKKAQALTEEMLFLKSAHQEEVADLFAQIQASQFSVDLKDFAKPDLTAALREIRAQMVGCTSDNLQETEEWFRCRVAALSEAAQINNEALQNRRQEISEYRRQLQTKSVELETARGTKETLEKQLADLEERHDAELVHYQDIIQQLENELKNSKWEMSHHLREYQDLLNVKMALDVEIASYRKLLEGEETRFGSIGGNFMPSYTYRQTQSLTHSVYASTKAKGTPTKAAPQYKFVEEIISETTKEVDMAELDNSVLRVVSDSGSGEKLELEEEESTKPEEDEDKDEATTAEASDEEEAERSSETKEESTEEEGIESKEQRVETKESEKKDMPNKESGITKAETTKFEEEPSKGKERKEYDTIEMKDEEKENAKIEREPEEKERTEKDSEKQAKDKDEQQSLKNREAIEEGKTAGGRPEGEVITDQVESKEQERAEAKKENEDKTEEAQTEASDAKGESIVEEQGEDHVAQPQEELKETSQREPAAEVTDENKDQKQVECIAQEPPKAKVERESAPQELAKESENQKVQTSEEAKRPEMSGEVRKPNNQAKEEKCEDKKPDICKKEGKEGNQSKEASTQEDKKDREEKTEQMPEAEKVAAGAPESKSTQSGERSPEALINGLDIKVDKEETESKTDRKTTKTSTEVIQKIEEKTIENKEGISKVSVTSTVETAVTEEIAKEKFSDPQSNSKESK